MKIKEVCRLTGLSEKAVRYYVECGLVNPSEYEVRGRTYREYDDNDVSELKNIITLRQLGMSIDNISQIKNDGTSIAQIMENYILDLSDEVEKKQKILEALKGENFNETKSIEQLIPIVKKAFVKETSLPDFSHIDNDYSSFEKVSLVREKLFERGARYNRFVMAVLLLGSLLAAFSWQGIVMFVIAAIFFLSRKSDNITFFSVLDLVGIAANSITAILILCDSDTVDYLYKISFLSFRMSLGSFEIIKYAAVILLQIIAFLMLCLCRPLREYLSKQKENI